METLSFLTASLVRDLGERHGTPLYVYDSNTLRQNAKAALDMPNAYGLTVRYVSRHLERARVANPGDDDEART